MSGFKDVVGHKNIIKYIQNAVTADAVSHAYILNWRERFREEAACEFVCHEPAM